MPAPKYPIDRQLAMDLLEVVNGAVRDRGTSMGSALITLMDVARSYIDLANPRLPELAEVIVLNDCLHHLVHGNPQRKHRDHGGKIILPGLPGNPFPKGQ